MCGTHRAAFMEKLPKESYNQTRISENVLSLGPVTRLDVHKTLIVLLVALPSALTSHSKSSVQSLTITTMGMTQRRLTFSSQQLTKSSVSQNSTSCFLDSGKTSATSLRESATLTKSESSTAFTPERRISCSSTVGAKLYQLMTTKSASELSWEPSERCTI